MVTDFRTALALPARALQQQILAAVEAAGLGTLSVPQLTALEHLDDVGPCGLTTLATSVGITKQSMSATVEGLVAAGLVRREVGPDRRSRTFSCTDVGAAVLAEADRAWTATVERWAAQLGVPEWNRFHALVTGLVEVIEDEVATAG